MKRLLFFIFIIIICASAYTMFISYKKDQSALFVKIQGNVDPTYQVRSETLNTIKKYSSLEEFEKKILVLYGKYQQDILMVFNDKEKSIELSQKNRLVLTCSDLYFRPLDKLKILDDIYFSVFNTPERIKAQSQYIQNIKNARYPNLEAEPTTLDKCRKLY